MKNKYGLAIVLIAMVLLLSSCIGDSEIEINIHEGNQKLEEKDYEKAIELYEDALEIDENNKEAKYGLAAAYINVGRYEEADQILSRVDEDGFNDIKCDTVVNTFLYYNMAKKDAYNELQEEDSYTDEELNEIIRAAFLNYQSEETDVKEKSDKDSQTELDGKENEKEEKEDEVVEFKDPVFEQAIRKLLELPEGPIMLSNISEVKHVSIYQVSGEIKTIEDLKLFENIELLELNCFENDLTIKGDLNTIGELSNLTFLRLCGTNLTGDLSALSNLSNLKKIEFDETGIRGDLSDISNLTNLKGIDMEGENITGNLSSLSRLSKLRGIYLAKTPVTGDLSSLSQCKELDWVNLDETGVYGDLSGISGLTKMQFLSLHKTAVSGDLSSLTGMSSLNSLYLSFTSVGGDLSVLSGLKNLNALSADKSNITGKITLSDGYVYDIEDW